MTCDAYDVVVVPFPFTDFNQTKRRPALVLSRRAFNQSGHTVMAMITSTSNVWPGDSNISELKPAGLAKACKVRLNFVYSG